MSRLKEFIAASMYPHGETELKLLHEALVAGMSRAEAKEWSLGKVAMELAAAGYVIEQRGTKDRPYKVVVELSFQAPPIDRGLARRIIKFFFGNTLYRYSVIDHGQDPEFNDNLYWLETVIERPGYSVEGYTIPYVEIATRAGAAGLRCDGRTAKASFQYEAREAQRYHIDAESPWEENESILNKYVRCLGDDGVVGYRWRLEGESPDREQYFGPYLPPEGQTSLYLKIRPGMIG